MRADVFMKAFDLAYRKRSENDLHKVLASLARRSPRFDMRQDRIRRNSLGGIGKIFLVSGYYFFLEPAFQSSISIQ